MEMIPAPRTAPAELTIDTVRSWILELTEVKRRRTDMGTLSGASAKFASLFLGPLPRYFMHSGA
jgi:hypothetical protein